MARVVKIAWGPDGGLSEGFCRQRASSVVLVNTADTNMNEPNFEDPICLRHQHQQKFSGTKKRKQSDVCASMLS